MSRAQRERLLRRQGMPATFKDWSMLDHFEDLPADTDLATKELGIEVIRKMAEVGERFASGDLGCWWEAFPELNPDLGL